jgi:hypothetical protein
MVKRVPHDFNCLAQVCEVVTYVNLLRKTPMYFIFRTLVFFLMFVFFLFCFIVVLLSSGVAGAYSIGTIKS